MTVFLLLFEVGKILLRNNKTACEQWFISANFTGWHDKHKVSIWEGEFKGLTKILISTNVQGL